MADLEITDPFYPSPHAFFSGLIATETGIGGEVVQIADRFYILDLASDRYRIFSIPALRPQRDDGEGPGQQTLSDAGLWRRSPSSWHHGAGQEWFDRDASDPFRFRASRGVNVWTRFELSLLPSSTSVVTEASGWTSLAVGSFTGGMRLVAAGGGGRCVTIEADGTVHEVTGLTGQVWATSTGDQVYVSDSTGIYPLDAAGTGLDAAFNTNITGAKLFFAKDRLWAADGADLYNVVDSTTSTAHFTHPWSGWVWTSVDESLAFAYACGFSGPHGQVYAIGIDPDGVTVLAPTIALPLPTTEVPHSVYGYLGLVAVGTSEGLRLCQVLDSGALVSGPIVGWDMHLDHKHPVRAIEGLDRFLWFGQDDLFTDAAALGRVDLTAFVDSLAPAYASDLTAGQVGQVNAVRYFDARIWFAVEDVLYVESPNLVTSGTLDTGRITMNVADRKAGVYVDVRHEPLLSGESIALRVDSPNNPQTLVGVSQVDGSERPLNAFPIDPGRALWHDLQVELVRSQPQDSPIVTGVTLAAQIAPDRSLNLLLPLILAESIAYRDREFHLDVAEELSFIVDLVFTQRLIRMRHGITSYLGFVEDFEWIPNQSTQDGRAQNGTCLVKVKTAEARR